MSANLAPLEALLSLIIDGINDGISIAESGKPFVQELPVLMNLIADAGPAFQNISTLPASLAGFSDADATSLIAFVGTKIAVPNAHATAIINQALAAAQAIYALILAIKTPVTA